MSEEKRRSQIGDPTKGNRKMDEVYNLKVEHNEIKKSLDMFGEKLCAIDNRQDTSEKTIATILSTLENNGRIEEESRKQSKSMAEDIRELTIIFGDIKTEMAKTAHTYYEMVDVKIHELDNKVNNDIKEVKEKLDSSCAITHKRITELTTDVDNSKLDLSDYKTEVSKYYISNRIATWIVVISWALVSVIGWQAYNRFDDFKTATESTDLRHKAELTAEIKDHKRNFKERAEKNEKIIADLIKANLQHEHN